MTRWWLLAVVFLIGAVLPWLTDYLGHRAAQPSDVEPQVALVGWLALVACAGWMAWRGSSVRAVAGRVTAAYFVGVVTLMVLLGPGNIWPIALAFAALFSLSAGLTGAAIGRVCRRWRQPRP